MTATFRGRDGSPPAPGPNPMRRLALILAAVGLASAAFAFASSLGPVAAGSVGNSGGSVNPCDTDGFTFAYTTSAGNVTSVVVGGVNAACSGGALVLTLTDSGGAAIGSGGPVAVGAGGSVTVSPSPQPYAGSVAGAQVVITGP